MEDDNRYFFVDGIVINSGKIYIPTGMGHTLFSFSMDNDKFEFIKVKTNIRKILDISSYKDEIWMTEWDESTGRVAIFDLLSDFVEEIILPSGGVWSAPFFRKGYAYFLPMSDNAVCYSVNVETKKAKVFNRLDDLFLDHSETNSGRRIANVLSFKQNGNKVTFIRRPDLTWFTYDFKTDELTSAVYEITDEKYINNLEKDYYDRLFDRDYHSNEIINEKEMPLNEFIQRVVKE